MPCCQDITMKVVGGCPPPIIDDVHEWKLGDPTTPNRPGCFFVNYQIHMKPGDYLWVRTMSYGMNLVPPFCFPPSSPGDPFPSVENTNYLFFMDSSNTVLFSRIGQTTGAVQIGVFIEVEDDYIIQVAPECVGATGFVRTTVWTDCGELIWFGNAAAAGTGDGPIEWVAPQSVQPLTWGIINGTLCSTLVFSNNSSEFPLFGSSIFGACGIYERIEFAIRVTDANGLQRQRKVKFNNIAFEGFRRFPQFILSPPLGVPYQLELVSTGGVPPYTLTQPIGSPPPGLTLNLSGQNAILSGTWTGGGMPTSFFYKIVDANLNFASAGISFLTCTGQNPISALTWTVTPTTPNPGAGDSVTGSISGGDGNFDLVNKYAGGACVFVPTEVNLTCQLCNPVPNTEYTVEMQCIISGLLGTEPACPAIGRVTMNVTGFGIPATVSIDGTNNHPYSTATDVLTSVLPSGGVVNVGILVQAVYSTMDLTVVFRPLTHP